MRWHPTWNYKRSQRDIGLMKSDILGFQVTCTYILWNVKSWRISEAVDICRVHAWPPRALILSTSLTKHGASVIKEPGDASTRTKAVTLRYRDTSTSSAGGASTFRRPDCPSLQQNPDTNHHHVVLTASKFPSCPVPRGVGSSSLGASFRTPSSPPPPIATTIVGTETEN